MLDVRFLYSNKKEASAIKRFLWVSDEVFLITPGTTAVSDATGLMRHPCLMTTSPGHPVRALLRLSGVIRKSNILHEMRSCFMADASFFVQVEKNETDVKHFRRIRNVRNHAKAN